MGKRMFQCARCRTNNETSTLPCVSCGDVAEPRIAVEVVAEVAVKPAQIVTCLAKNGEQVKLWSYSITIKQTGS